jgi:hypothetical protein
VIVAGRIVADGPGTDRAGRRPGAIGWSLYVLITVSTMRGVDVRKRR